MKLFSTTVLVLLAIVAAEARRGSNRHLQKAPKASKVSRVLESSQSVERYNCLLSKNDLTA